MSHQDVWKGNNLGDRDEGVHDGLLLNDVVGSLVIVGVLQLVSFFAKQGLPQGGFHLDTIIKNVGQRQTKRSRGLEAYQEKRIKEL